MRYIFRITTDEQVDFSMLIQIDSEATFFHLHQLIAQACRYEDGQMASFFTVNQKGQRLQEISLVEMSAEGEEVNVAVMDVAILREFVHENVKHIEYVYDFFGDRFFIITLEEVREGEQLENIVLQQKGTVPPQMSLDGFVDFQLEAEKEKKTPDYEQYLSSFDDCNDDDKLGF